jgi:cytidine deaminase
MASGWLVWNKQRMQSSSSSSSKPHPTATWNMVADGFLLGSLLLWKTAKESEMLTKNDDDDDDGSTEIKKHAGDASEVLEWQRQATIQNGKQPRTISPTAMALLPPPALDKEGQKQSNEKQQRYVELMVHNVSHTDLVLSLDAPLLPASTESGDSFCLCRPRFSAFDDYTKRIVEFVTQRGPADHKNQNTSFAGLPSASIIRVPRYERFDDNARNNQIKPEPSSPLDKIPLGFHLTRTSSDNEPLEVSASQLKDLRIRGKDAPRIAHLAQSPGSIPVHINAVFFPLLATLIPIWQAKMKEKYSFLGHQSPPSQRQQSTCIKKVLILVTGVGTPRNWTHSMNGNSTFQCARLMKFFLQTICPELVVLHLHSGPDQDIFRYDANIAFVQQKLLPHVNAYRDAHAKGLPYPDEVSTKKQQNRSNLVDDDLPFWTEWGKSFHITLSFADGSPARNYAIQAALRSYKPTFFHFWQLKTFWHESKIVDSDVEEHSFEEMETLPPIETNQLGHEKPDVLQVVEEMKRFREEMVKLLAEGDDSNDIRRFWLRKTRKPVLAVLAVKVASGGLKLYRGTNMEVSMPTGSLCAERNVIGSALADNPGLKRQDLKLIAVLAVPVPKRNSSAINIVTGWLPRLHSAHSMSSLQYEEDGSQSSKPPMNPSRKSSLGEEEDWINQDHSGMSVMHKNFSFGGVPSGTLHVPAGMSQQPPNPPSEASTPVRRIPLYKSQQQSITQKRTVVVHSDEDINPLLPCGACNEWLKKIAESNPYFTIVTFTDSACNGVYCTPCEE